MNGTKPDQPQMILYPENRFMIDAPDIQRLLALHQDKMDMELVREYFKIFGKEDLLDEWLNKIK